MQAKPSSAYVHIPFCTQICYYCDFSKVFIKNQPVDAYLEHLIQETRSYEIGKLRTLYIGGGTPTALSAQQLAYLLTELPKVMDLSEVEEFTIEANPGDLDPDKIAVLKDSQVNRVSLGVQTFDNKMLKKIGRSHQEQDIYDNIRHLKQAGFDNISIDLIYALPGQTMDQVKENVAKAIDLDIPHMSLYSLILENHTVFMNRMRRGKLPLPKEELEAEIQQELADLYMEKARFQVRFTPSKFNREGNETVEFYISTNPGEDFKPLVKVASGGELSRLMLAIKSAFSRKEGKTSIVFDEVDTGVSGRVAQAIASKIYKIGRYGQVLAISHLPQVIAVADYQFFIEKVSDEFSTVSTVRLLSHEERVEEVAKMLAGEDVTEAARMQAEQLLKRPS